MSHSENINIMYPPENVLSPPFGNRDNEQIILWMLSNNKFCRWSDFKVEISESTLSGKLNNLISKDLVEKPERDYYQITPAGKERLSELVYLKESGRRKLNYPPKAIISKRNYDHVALWMVNNNDYCKWSDFREEPLSINQSSLSKNLNLLMTKGFVINENKQYKITPDGKTEYSKVLKLYDLDRQSILEEESKRIEDITKKTIKFFEKYEIEDDELKFRFLNNKLKLDYAKVKNTLSNEEDFDKILLFLSLNHPNQYPEYISPEEFSSKYDIKKTILDYYVYKIVEENFYPIKFFKLEDEQEKIYFFQANERIEKVLRAIVKDYIIKFTYLNKLYEKILNNNPSLDSTHLLDNILDDICDSLFNKNLIESLSEFLPEYIKYLAYKIETEKRLIETFDKLEGIVWQNIQEVVKNYYPTNSEYNYYIDPTILEIIDPFFSSKIEEIYKNIQPLIKKAEYDKDLRRQNMIKKVEYNKALEKVDSAIKLNQRDLGLIIFKAKILCLLKEFKKAIKTLKRGFKGSPVIKDDQIYISYFFMLAFSYIARGNFEVALNSAKKMLELYPNHPISYATKALVLGYNIIYIYNEEKANEDYALDDIDKAISLDPNKSNKARYYQFKSIILQIMEKHNEAINAIDSGIDLDPKIIDLYFTKTKILVSNKQLEQALSLIEDQIKEFPNDNKNFYLKKAWILKLKGNLDEGLEIIENLINLYPEDYDLLNTKAYWFMHMKNKQEAIETIQNLIELVPNDGNYYDSYGEILMEFKDYEKAIEKFQKALKLDPYGWFTNETYNKMGTCYKELGKIELAIENIEKGKKITNTCLCDFETRKSLIKKIDNQLIEIKELQEKLKEKT